MPIFAVRSICLAAASLALLALAGCAPVRPSSERAPVVGRQVRAVGTIGMITDLVRNIGAEHVEAIALMGPGVDPHLYKASEGDVIRLSEADVVFFNGLHLEAKMGDVLERMEGRALTVAVTERIDRDRLLAPPEFEGASDPHVWFDVTLWMQAAVRIRDALVEVNPENAAAYRANADSYLAELKLLDEYVRGQAGSVPADRRVLITAHDAFNYFGKAYGFQVRGLQGISTVTESWDR